MKIMILQGFLITCYFVTLTLNSYNQDLTSRNGIVASEVNNGIDSSIYAFSATSIDGKTIDLSVYRGKVVLIVNTASKCGFTPQYKELQELYTKYGSRGFEVLGFPCNQFASQEPGNEDEIKSFCSLNYGVTFQMFSKIDVNGEHAHPLYQYLTSRAKGIMGTESIKWNFTKFLIDRKGNIVERYAPQTNPLSIEDAIAKLL